MLFTCIKSWFFRNHLANFHQISHWSFCWNVIDSLFKWSCSIDCQAHIFFFKTKNCSNDDIFISCDDRIGKMLHNICMSAVAMSLRWANRGPWASCYKKVCYGYPFAVQMSTHNICFYKENQKKSTQEHCISIIWLVLCWFFFWLTCHVVTRWAFVVTFCPSCVRPSVNNFFKQHLIGFWPNLTGTILGWSSFKVV